MTDKMKKQKLNPKQIVGICITSVAALLLIFMVTGVGSRRFRSAYRLLRNFCVRHFSCRAFVGNFLYYEQNRKRETALYSQFRVYVFYYNSPCTRHDLVLSDKRTQLYGVSRRLFLLQRYNGNHGRRFRRYFHIPVVQLYKGLGHLYLFDACSDCDDNCCHGLFL